MNKILTINNTDHPINRLLDLATNLSLDKSPQSVTQLLTFALLEHAERNNIHNGKITNGCMGENVTCNLINGLTWNSKNTQKEDAVNTRGQPCELKTCVYKKSKLGNQYNINYHGHRAIDNNETLEHYAKAIEQHYKTKEYEGGHYWALYSVTGLHKSWWFPRDGFAVFVRESIIHGNLSVNGTLNFGSVCCKKCFSVHRIDNLNRLISNDQSDISHWVDPSEFKAPNVQEIRNFLAQKTKRGCFVVAHTK